MCMSIVKENMKTLNRKPIYGFKSVKVYSQKEFGPLYINQQDRWIKGEWYKPNYQRIHSWESVKTGRRVTHSGIYSAIIMLLRKVRGSSLAQVRPMIDSGNYASNYECGFHFFTDVHQADLWQRNHYPNAANRKLVLCEFTGVTAVGSQWNQEVKVARRMRIIKIINRSQLGKLMEEING